MVERFCESWLRIDEIRARPERRLLESYAGEILRAGYKAETARGHIRTCEHLVYWAGRRGTPVTAYDQQLVETFIRHLERHRCPGLEHTRRSSLPHVARLFVAYLQRSGVVTTPPNEPGRGPALIVSFCEWMRQQRGTSDTTLDRYRLDLCELLKSLGEDPATFNAQNLRKFVLERSERFG